MSAERRVRFHLQRRDASIPFVPGRLVVQRF
jgi:hypothetical protein